MTEGVWGYRFTLPQSRSPWYTERNTDSTESSLLRKHTHIQWRMHFQIMWFVDWHHITLLHITEYL